MGSIPLLMKNRLRIDGAVAGRACLSIAILSLSISLALFIVIFDSYAAGDMPPPSLTGDRGLDGVYKAGSVVVLRNPYPVINDGDGWNLPYSGSEYVSGCTWIVFDADMKIVSMDTHEPSYIEQAQNAEGEFIWKFYDIYEYGIPSTFFHSPGTWRASSYFTLSNGAIVCGQEYMAFTVEGSFLDDFTTNLFMSVSLVDLFACAAFAMGIIYLMPFILAKEKKPFFDHVQAFLKKGKVLGKKQRITPRQRTVAIVSVFILLFLMVLVLMVI